MRHYKVTYQSIEDLSIHTIEVEAEGYFEARGKVFLQRGWEILSTLSVEPID